MFVLSHKAPVERVDRGVTRQVLGHDPGLMMVRVTFEKGAAGPIHAHPHRQVTYVERGRFEATVNSTTTVVTAGDCFFVAPDVPHGAVALEEGSLIDVFAPARLDFVDP
jgi:quercetin dioxygenase-like cupin family protein